MSVLLLNASYEPLRIISARRAMTLILTGKAESVEDSDREMRTVSRAYPVPLIARLRHMVRVPFRARVPLNRHTLTVRDDGACQVAGCHVRGTTTDHVIPKSRGGKHVWGNVVLMCARHNRLKEDRLLSELDWRLKVAPRSPSGHYLVLVTARTKLRQEWAPFLGVSAQGAAVAR